MSNSPYFYTVSHKTSHSIFVHNFEKCWSILKSPSLLDSIVNLHEDSYHISHHILNVSLHYLVKYKRLRIAMLLMYLTQYHRFVSKHWHVWALESY